LKKSCKQPISVLVLIHTPKKRVLLIERTAHPGFWQSVTGSREGNESLSETARREVEEETGIVAPICAFQDWQISNNFEILERWRQRYADGVTRNTEHVFSLCVPEPFEVQLNPLEHKAQRWLPWQEAARKCFSWTNQDAILMLARHSPHTPYITAPICQGKNSSLP
jgi:dihydroneopterin triphosphate diphosphatase